MTEKFEPGPGTIANQLKVLFTENPSYDEEEVIRRITTDMGILFEGENGVLNNEQKNALIPNIHAEISALILNGTLSKMSNKLSKVGGRRKKTRRHKSYKKRYSKK